ncbi:MAG: ABC transporter permease subunit, partial [Dehalococcoidia bacterium]
MTEQTGEVFDLGYRHYEGPREGRMRARQALVVNGVRTVIGLGRGWQSKVLPALLFLAVVVPAVGISLTASTADAFEDIPGHADYYRIVAVILFLFSATMAPELLCPDRRDRVIVLYLVRPLTTTDYVVGRYLAFFAVMLALVLFGQIILFIGLTLADDEPLTYMTDNWLDVPRFLVAGVVVAIFPTTIPLAVSTFTIRRAYAAAIVIALFLVSLPVAAILSLCDEGESTGSSSFGETQTQCEPATGDAAKWFALLSFPEVPMHVNDLVFDDESTSDFAELVHELPAAVP